jgi:hypothetical protein
MATTAINNYECMNKLLEMLSSIMRNEEEKVGNIPMYYMERANI